LRRVHLITNRPECHAITYNNRAGINRVALSLLFSQKYEQNYRAFKIQNLSESKKE
jgi:hypothetical protein